MSRIFDFHSHILPGIDDGSKSLCESIAMLRMEAEQGIEHVVATPHFYAQYDSPECFLARRSESVARLQEEMAKYDNLPQLHVGAEVYYFPGMSHSDLLSRLTIDGKTCILIEMPVSPWTSTMYRELEEIHTRRGLVPIIAHIDRYIRPFHTHHIPQQLERLPVLVQANADFFLQVKTRRMAVKMLRTNRINLLGSDCHNLTSRVPNLGDAVNVIRRNLGDLGIERIQSYQDMVLMDLENN